MIYNPRTTSSRVAWLLGICFCVLLLAACGAPASSPESVELTTTSKPPTENTQPASAPSTQDSLPQETNEAAEATPAATTTPSSIPTLQPSPTAAATVQPTPTPLLPVGHYTPLPEGLLPLSPQTASRTVMLSVLSKGLVNEMRWSPDGKLHVLTQTGYFQLNSETLQDEGGIYFSTHFKKGKFSDDGSVLALYDSDKVTLLETEGFTTLGTIPKQGFDSIWSVALSPDGSLLATGTFKGLVHIWQVQDQQLLRTTEAQSNYVQDLAFSPDGTQIAGAIHESGFVPVWQVADATEQLRASAAGEEVEFVIFSPSGRHFAGATADASMLIWSAASGKPVQRMKMLPTRPTADLTFTPDGKSIFFFGDDLRIRMHGTEDGKFQRALQLENGKVVDMVVSPDGSEFITAQFNGTLTRWKLGNFEQQAATEGFWRLGSMNTVGENIYTIDPSNSIRTWEVLSGQLLQAIQPAPDDSLWQLRSSLNGSIMIYSTRSGKIYRLLSDNTADGELIYDTGDSLILNLEVSPDGEQILQHSTNAGRYEAELLNLQGEVLSELPGNNRISNWTYSPDSRLLAYIQGSDYQVMIYDAKTGELFATLTPEGLFATSLASLAFSPDGSLAVAGAGKGDIYLWQLADGQLLKVWPGHPDEIVSTLAFSHDGQLLASGTYDGDLKLWDLATFQELAHLFGHNQAVYDLEFGPEDAWLSSNSADTVRIWGVLP